MIDLLTLFETPLGETFLLNTHKFMFDYRLNEDIRKRIDTKYSVFLILGHWRESNWKSFGKDVIKIICQYALLNDTIPVLNK